jgi:signal transduction histidine kinase
MTAPRPASITLWTAALATTLVIAVAASHAVKWYGHYFPGVLITADGNVSSIGMPTWSGIAQGLRFPDQVESVDGIPLEGPRGTLPAAVWDRAVDTAVAAGHTSVHVRVHTAAGTRDLDLKLDRLDAESWWLYAGTTIFMAGLYALAAFIALHSSPRGAVARAFANFALPAAAFFVTIFDAHTTRAMVPLFHAAFAWVPFALVGLALRLPDDVPLIARYPWVPRVLDGAGLSLAGSVLLRDLQGRSVATLQSVCTLLFGGGMIAFVLVMGARYARARGTRRDLLRVLWRATATPYALVGAGLIVTMLSSRGSTAAFFSIPALALAPMATGLIFVRHDVWGSRALLSRVAARSLASAVTCALAIGVGGAFASSVGVPFRDALIAASGGAVVSAVLVLFVARAVERRLFPAVAEYKPTVEQLSEELTAIADPKELALAVERTVRRWLPCDRVEFMATTEAPPSRVRDPDEIEIPAAFGGENLGSLVVGRKRGGALFTTDDMDLLRTIANQAALALAYALSYAELEQRRQQQAAAWQTERIALVETVAAEIAHEVRYPINFFRAVFRRDRANARLDQEEIDVGCEEVDRLERIVSGLRRMVSHRIERRSVTLVDLMIRVEMLLRDSLVGRVLAVDVPDYVVLRCDPDQATQVLVNLMANAIEATGPGGRIGVIWTAGEEGGELVVWDDGTGFTGDASQLFAPWFTTKPRGTGLGLAITQRIVRAHGWSIDVARAEGRTRFVVSVSASDIVNADRATPVVPERVSGPQPRDELA